MSDIWINKIHQGNALDILKQMPSESVHCCVTSPPYWGLRAYGTDLQVWDGDTKCEHEWDDPEPPKRSRWGDMDTMSDKQSSNRGSQQNVEALELPSGNFCKKCKAWKGELGLEPTPGLYVQHLVEIFREIKRVLRDDGTLWLNLGDSYAGGGGANGVPKDWDSLSMNNRGKYPTTEDPKRNAKLLGLKPKDLIGIPWMVAFALRADGWYLRCDIIWHKKNCMPESITDRPTKSHEYIFLLAKNRKYFYDNEAIKEKADGRNCGNKTYKYDGVAGMDTKQGILDAAEKKYFYRNKRSVWTISPHPFLEAHFATFPEALIEPCIKAGCPTGGVVLDPFMGAGTTALVSRKLYRNWIGIELNASYIEIAKKRIRSAIEQKGIYEFKGGGDDMKKNYLGLKEDPEPPATRIYDIKDGNELDEDEKKLIDSLRKNGKEDEDNDYDDEEEI